MKLDQTHDIISYIKKFIIDNENKLQKNFSIILKPNV